MFRRQNFVQLLSSNPATCEESPILDSIGLYAASPFKSSPWNNLATSSAAYTKSPWIVKSSSPLNRFHHANNDCPRNGPVGTIVREVGHVYSLATASDLLYTGSESKIIRVWKNLNHFSALRSGSGLVKAIVVFHDRLFTGHQDGMIRIWKIASGNSSLHRRVGNLPTTVNFLKSSMNPKNYVEVRRNKSVLRIQHYDAVSCLCFNRELGLLYSGSWDKTVKVWRVSDYKFLESIDAHCDAVNAIGSGFGNLIFTGSADGTVKAWKTEADPTFKNQRRKKMKHFLIQLMLNQGTTAVTALAVNASMGSVYSGSSDGLVNVWEMKKKEGILRHHGVLRGHKLSVLCLAAAGKLLLSGSADCSICVWQKEGAGVHTCLSVLTGHDGPVKCLTVKDGEGESDGRERRWAVYSGSLDKSVKLWTVVEER